MVEVNDRVIIESERVGEPPRTGVVTGVDGRLIRVHWDGGGDSSFLPQAGSMHVVGHSTGEPPQS